MGASLTVEGLTVAYGHRSGRSNVVLSDVGLELMPGEVLGLAGESGCGKSTLALCTTGYRARGTEVLRGRVQLGDTELLSLEHRELRRIWGKRISFVAQSASGALNPALSIGRQLTQALRAHGMRSRASLKRRQSELLDSVGLPDPEHALTCFAHQFSGGQQQRIAIAIALASQPDVLILDEPTTGLDVTTQARISALLRRVLAETGSTALYVSHDLALLSTIADRLAVMYAGQIVEQAPCESLIAMPRHPYTRALLAAVPTDHPARRLTGIPGAPPPGAVLGGCAFAPRCRWQNPCCTRSTVNAVPVEADHMARCVRLLEIPLAEPASTAPSVVRTTPHDDRPLLTVES